MEEATALLEKLTDADWKRTTAAEKWTIALTAHHIASSYESATHIIKTIAAGQALPHFTWGSLDEIREDVGRYAEAGLTELFLEANFDPRGATLDRALEGMDALAPGAA